MIDRSGIESIAYWFTSDLIFFAQVRLWSLISFFLLIQMEEDGFLTDILLDRDHGSVAGGTEDNFNIPITQGITSDVGVRGG